MDILHLHKALRKASKKKPPPSLAIVAKKLDCEVSELEACITTSADLSLVNSVLTYTKGKIDKKDRTEKKSKDKKKDKKSKKRSLSEAISTDTKSTSTSTSISVSSKSNPSVDNSTDGVSILLFYTYIDPVLSTDQHKQMLKYIKSNGEKLELGGRMRVAREGLNCTLTGTYHNVRQWATDLQTFGKKADSSTYPDGGWFDKTEFKFTDNLPAGQHFPKLNAFVVDEVSERSE